LALFVTKEPEKVKTWLKTPLPNMFRHAPSGTYYVRVRVGRNNARRESLGTSVYEIAAARLGPRKEEILDTKRPRKGSVPATLWDTLRIIEAQIESDPTLKQSSREAYGEVISSLKPGGKGRVPVPVTSLLSLTHEEMEEWWGKTAASYSPDRANYQLLLVRRALRIAKERKAISRDVGATLKRVPVPKTRLRLIAPKQFRALVHAIRQEPRGGKDAADWVELVAYTGMRAEEACAACWEHIDLVNNVLTVTGNATGTKNRRERHIPITERLRVLLRRIQRRTGATTGRIVSVDRPIKIIRRGCAAIGIPNMRRKDFRHLFATRCIESGIDAPTVAKWLGHQDGGSLALRTYVHPTTDHEQRSAARVKF
jgi:integrase